MGLGYWRGETVPFHRVWTTDSGNDATGTVVVITVGGPLGPIVLPIVVGIDGPVLTADAEYTIPDDDGSVGLWSARWELSGTIVEAAEDLFYVKRSLTNANDAGSGLIGTPASQLLAALLTVDGPGSLLDADTLDGLDSTAFASSATITAAVAAHAAAVDPHGDRTFATAAIAAAVANLVASAPALLDTLDELAAALGDDANFATTITNALANKQPVDTDLTALAALVSAADKFPYATGAGTWTLGSVTTFARTLLDDIDAATARTTLGLGTAATTASTDYQPVDSDLTAIAALTTTSFGRSLLVLADAAAGRTALALGTAATNATGDFQPIDSDLTAISALTTTSYGRAFLALADAAAGRTALGLGTAATTASTDYQPVDSDLTAIAALTTTSYGRAFLALADAAAGRTALALGTAATTAATDYATTAQGVLATNAVPSTGPRPYYMNAYTNFFAGPFVTAQGTTGTTLTAQATAAATTMSVTSGASFPNGTVIITNQGTATQQQYVVTSGGSTTTLTISPAIVTTIANGATINPLWTNSFHMTSAGYTAFYYWIFHYQIAGVNLIQAPAALKRVTFLGNSWGTLGSTEYAAQIAAALPGSLSTNTSVSGNTSALMLARFDTDVPSDSSYVIINEPAANDINGQTDLAAMATTVSALVAKCQAIGATAVFTGMMQSWDRPGQALRDNTFLLGVFSAPLTFPATSTTGMLNILEPSSSNLGLGRNAAANITTGLNNTALGDSALKAATAATANTAVGTNALLGLTVGGGVTAVGTSALASLTTASHNTVIGQEAGYKPNNVAGNAITTGSDNTFIGWQTGYTSSTQSTNCTALGHQTLAGGGNYATALGSKASAGAAGTVALGVDSAGTGATSTVSNEIKIGTALHTTNIIGAALIGAAGTNVGFYGTTPIAKQTGVAVTAAGIHAACVALGLFAP